MPHFFLPFLAIVLGLCITPAAPAAEPIRFGRTPDISPDGSLIAFSYLGDIWVVDASGGIARLVTMHERHEINPIFSPDGTHLAFASNRYGSYDIFVVPVQGGRPTRLTHDAADDHPTGWSPDGKSILFTSRRTTDFPSRNELFIVPVAGGMAQRINVHEGREGAYSPDGASIAYVSGPGTWYRKGYRGSSNDEIWACKVDGTLHRRVTTFNGQDNCPMWSPDGRYIYYVSEHGNSHANIVRQDLHLPVGSGGNLMPPVPITFHNDETVRRARISANGKWLVYECGADLYVLSTIGGPPRKLAIEAYADDKANPEYHATYTSGATEFSLSSSEKHVAFVVHGEIFLMPRTGGKAHRLTDDPAYDHGVAWSPDSKKILFLSDRAGQEDIYLLEPNDPDHTELVNAHRFKVSRLTSTAEAEFGLTFSPDGKRVSFLRAGKLITMNADGTQEKIVAADGQIFDYDWSPDSRWIAYARQDSSFASELFIIPASGATAAEPARNVTRFATYNGGVTWSKTGHKLAFVSQRKRNVYGMYVLSLQKPAAADAAASKDIDWEDIHLRVRQPSAMSVWEGAISNDGTKVAFRGIDEGHDLWVASSDGGQLTRLTNNNSRPTQITWSRTLSSALYFRDNSGNIRMASIGGTGGIASIPFVAKLTVRRDEQFQEIFEQSWRALNETFYDPKFHGADWDRVRDKYRPLVRHCAAREDLFALISLMLGELNASHLGISGNLPSADQQTADLGLLFDHSYKGLGLKIAEIVKRGPADRRGLNLKPGEIILRVDQTELSAELDLARVLNDKIGETLTLVVAPDAAADAKKRRRVEIVGASRASVAQLMYERWVERNARKVAELSKGKLGYIHIPSMDEPGLDGFMRSLYSDCFDKDAIVLDVRYNGGGYTHEQILNYLGGKEHTLFLQRDGSRGAVLNFNDRKWAKPLILLINNRSFSDAEIFPHAFRTLGLGKLVGEPTGGLVIGTRNIQLIDGSTFRTPRIGVTTFKGVNMDKEGVVPDHLVPVHPDDLARGHDPQLEKAVEVLQQDVIVWKKTKDATAQVRPGDAAGPLPALAPQPGPPPMPAPDDE